MGRQQLNGQTVNLQLRVTTECMFGLSGWRPIVTQGSFSNSGLSRNGFTSLVGDKAQRLGQLLAGPGTCTLTSGGCDEHMTHGLAAALLPNNNYAILCGSGELC